jgi:hypothetical protein
MDTRTAQALINKEPGLAPKVLLSIKQQLEGMATNLQVLGLLCRHFLESSCTKSHMPC